MIIYPAIDLIDGKCVRLINGDFNKKKIYNLNPINVAKKFKIDGAEWLHVIDLDGAKNQYNRQIKLIKSIIKNSGLRVQVGGGIRSFEDINELIKIGAERIIVGSLAIKKPALTKKILKFYDPEKICIATDILSLNGKNLVSVSGWQESSSITVEDLIQDLSKYKLKHVLCTDISKDGTLKGPNFKLYSSLQEEFKNIHFQASGGISSLNDLKNLTTDGVIIGKSLYEERFTLKEAIKVSKC